MTELDNLSKSETQNLATPHRLACTGQFNKLRVAAGKVAYCRNLLNYEILYRPNGEEQLNLVFHFCLDCPVLSFETTPTSVPRFSDSAKSNDDISYGINQITGFPQGCQSGNQAKFSLQTHISKKPPKNNTLLTETRSLPINMHLTNRLSSFLSRPFPHCTNYFARGEEKNAMATW